MEQLPEVQLQTVNGWRILMTHICGMPPKGERGVCTIQQCVQQLFADACLNVIASCPYPIFVLLPDFMQ